MKVLIVDDEILVRKGLSLGVDWSELGFTDVFEANNGLAALEIVKEEQPELIFTDIRMPKMNGLELIEKVKAAYPDTVIFVLSCVNDGESIREALKFNRAMDYIPKLSMTTEEITHLVCKAKSYIRSENQAIDSGFVSVFDMTFGKKLKSALEDNDQDLVTEVVEAIMRKALAAGLTKESFVEWHEVYSMFSSRLKEMDVEAADLTVLGIPAYQYLNDAETIEMLRKRFANYVESYFENLKVNKGIYYGIEIRHAIKYVKDNYNQPLKLSDLAEEIGLNESYLSRLFKKQVGMNFSEYVNITRLKQAKRLLVENGMTVGAVAREVGYNSESYFSRIFRQYEDLSPKQYVSKIMQENDTSFKGT